MAVKRSLLDPLCVPVFVTAPAIPAAVLPSKPPLYDSHLLTGELPETPSDGDRSNKRLSVRR